MESRDRRPYKTERRALSASLRLNVREECAVGLRLASCCEGSSELIELQGGVLLSLLRVDIYSDESDLSDSDDA